MHLIAEYSDDDAEAQECKKFKEDAITAPVENKCKRKLTHKETYCFKSECATLDDSDFECEIQDHNEHPCSRKAVSSTGVKRKTKRIDYLNLHSSDSDDENQNIHYDVTSLLNSAAVLNNVECGPIKSTLNRDAGMDTFRNNERIINDSVVASYDPELLYGNIQKHKLKDTISNDYKENSNCGYDVLSDDDSEDEVLCNSNSDIYEENAKVSREVEGASISYIPSKSSRAYKAHKRMVTALTWCRLKYSHLLLSASADCTLKIWDLFSRSSAPVRCIRNSSALKAAEWSCDGRKIFAGGYSKKVHVYDPSNGKEICSYDVNNYVSSIEAHPLDNNLFLCGTENAMISFDLRENSVSPSRTFLSNCKEVLDMKFLDECSFVCSTNVVSQDSADRTIMVWDLRSGAILSNQIFLELYTCPSIKINKRYNSFAAQTNGDYIAIFSLVRPYKIQNKRFLGHKVSGYGIECDISPNGEYLVTGSADGDLYFYDYRSSDIRRKLTIKPGVAINKVNWHPVLCSTVATASWDGYIQILK